LAALRRLARRPTLWVEVAVVAAWIGLLLLFAAASRGESVGSGWGNGRLWLCMTNMGGGMVGTGSARHLAAAGPHSLSLLAAAPMSGLMVFAMMVPTAMPAVRHVGTNSIYWRRRRATIEFLAAYLGIWLCFGALTLAVSTSWRQTGSPYVLVAALTVAALWQLSPAKRRALIACHRSRPLPLSGWQASAGAARFGLYNGGACLASCWTMMLLATLAGAGVLLMGVMTVAMSVEKLATQPRRAARRIGIALAAAALAVVAAALLS
jgi:predicted metal-binding membrane protein